MNTSKANDATEHPGRQCSPCTACCDGWLSAKIRQHQVAAGHPCPYSQSGGCSIYAERPEVPCRTFICSWRVAESPLPDWMRPDQSGAIVLLSLPWEGELVISAIPVGAEIPERTLEWLQSYARKYQRPLIFYTRLIENGEYRGMKRIGYGPPTFRQKVADLNLNASNDSVAMNIATPDDASR